MQTLQGDKTCPKCKKGILKTTNKDNWYEIRCPYCGFGIGKPQTTKGEVEEEIKQKLEIEAKKFKNRHLPVTPLKKWLKKKQKII